MQQPLFTELEQLQRAGGIGGEIVYVAVICLHLSHNCLQLGDGRGIG